MMKNINSLITSVCFFLFIGLQGINAQVVIEGYAFESGNRGFLNQVFVEVFNAETNELIGRSRSDKDGKFQLTAPSGKRLILKGSKDLFHESEQEISTIDKASEEKVFVKLEMKRAPGYIFEITLADRKDSIDQVVDAIRGALIEVYNNTTREAVMALKDHPHPEFKVDLEKGNHYTVMIRKEGYLAKRMEAFVNVKGCILCFEGVGEIQPGVSDNLTEGNAMGTLLANVEMDKVYSGKKITLNNIYYDFGKASIRKDAVKELQNAATFLMDNPRITVELASHTDSRGQSHKNQALSEKRARNTVEWLLENSELPARRIVARGYGETQLINKCGNGSDCSDAEHGANRRTEFKVLSIAPQEEFKSLEKIKFEENMDVMLAELESEGQVKVTDEAELEKLKKDGALDGKVKESKEKVEDIENDETQQKNGAIRKTDEAIESSEMPRGGAETVDAGNTEIKTDVSAEAASANMTQSAVKTIATKAASNSDKDLVESISTDQAIDMVNTLGDFSGFKYVIHFSGEQLSEDHDLYRMHDDIKVLQTKSNNFLYMIGDYASKVYASSGLKTVQEKYPDAYVIGFKNGKRVE